MKGVSRAVFATGLLATLLCHPALALYSPKDDVVILTDKNFKDEVIKAEGVVLVEFYAPWCGHCKQLSPAWKKAASALKGVVKVAALDATANEKAAGPYGIRGFPTIKVFGANKSKPTDFQGGRDADSIVKAGLAAAKSLVNRRLSGGSSGSSKSSKSSKSGGSGSGSGSGSNAVVTLTESNFREKVLKSGEPWLVEFYAPWCGHCKNLAPEWEKAAKELKGKVNVGAVDATEHGQLAQQFGVKGYPTIKMFEASASSPNDAKDYQGARTAEAIIEVAMQQLSKPPEAVELTGPKVWDELCEGKRICLVGVLPDIRDAGAATRKGYIKTLNAVAKRNGGSLFNVLWTSAGAHPDLESKTGLEFGFPAFVAVNRGKGRYAVHTGSFAEKAMNIFTTGIKTGRTKTRPFDSIAISSVAAWDGLDAAPVEEEFSLEDLMGDDEL